MYKKHHFGQKCFKCSSLFKLNSIKKSNHCNLTFHMKLSQLHNFLSESLKENITEDWFIRPSFQYKHYRDK